MKLNHKMNVTAVHHTYSEKKDEITCNQNVHDYKGYIWMNYVR